MVPITKITNIFIIIALDKIGDYIFLPDIKLHEIGCFFCVVTFKDYITSFLQIIAFSIVISGIGFLIIPRKELAKYEKKYSFNLHYSTDSLPL